MHETVVVCKFCQQNVDWKCGDMGKHHLWHKTRVGKTRKGLYCAHSLMVKLAYEK